MSNFKKTKMSVNTYIRTESVFEGLYAGAEVEERILIYPDEIIKCVAQDLHTCYTRTYIEFEELFIQVLVKELTWIVLHELVHWAGTTVKKQKNGKFVVTSYLSESETDSLADSLERC